MTKILIINSNHSDTVLPWCNCAIRNLYGFLKDENEDVDIIEGEQANPSVLKAYIDNHPELERIYGLGHGSATTFHVSHVEPFISTNKNLDLVDNRVVHLLSCLTALQLGSRISETASAYYGYKKPFWIIGEDRTSPCSCRFVTAIFVGDIQLEHSIQNNRDYETCKQDAIQKWDDEIAYWEEHYDEETIPIDGGGNIEVTDAMAQTLIGAIMSNRDAFRLYTDEIPVERLSITTGHLVSIASLAALCGITIKSLYSSRYT